MVKKKCCENCEEELTTEEKDYGSNWCFDCLLPEKNIGYI